MIDEFCRDQRKQNTDECEKMERLVEVGRRIQKYFRARQTDAMLGLNSAEKIDIDSKIELFTSLLEDEYFGLKKNSQRRVYRTKYGVVIENGD